MTVNGDELRIPITAQPALGEVADPEAAAALAELFAGMAAGTGDGAALGADMMRMIASISLTWLTGIGMAEEDLQALLAATGNQDAVDAS